MKLAVTSPFRRRVKKLTPVERTALSRALQRFQADPFDPRLRTHKLTGELSGYWSFSVLYDLRVVCRIDAAVATLISIGSHNDVY
ncbi:MAG: type II toxin-antitoxin system YafQ family toxin [Chloroflexota bacterium]